MKKLSILSVALSAALFTGVASAQVDGIVKFRGKIVDQTCKIDSGSGDKTITVNLPTVSAESLNVKGTTAGLTAFSIALKECAAAQVGANKVKAHFLPHATNVDTAEQGTLKNIKAGGSKANNVNVQLLNKNRQPIIIGELKATDDSAETVQTGNVALNYHAQYYATNQATAGEVEATAEFNIAYE